MFMITAYILNMAAVIMTIILRILFEQDRKNITDSWTELDKNSWFVNTYIAIKLFELSCAFNMYLFFTNVRGINNM